MSAPARAANVNFPAITTQHARRTWPALDRLRTATTRHPGAAAAAVGLILITLIALLGSAALPVPDPDAQALRSRLQPPLTRGTGGTLHLAGTDQLGRDVLSRTIDGARLSLGIAFSTVLLSGVVGSLIGLFVGFRGGMVDFIAMRWVDLQMAVPPLLLAIFLLYLIGSSVTNLVALLVFFAWVGYARVVRAETMRLRSAPFVESAVVAGAGESRILIRHIFPQLLPVLVAIAVVEFAAIILAEAGLSFLGLGVQPPDSSWGRMVSDGQAFVTTGAWWLFAVPGAAIFVTVLLARLAAPWVQSLFGAEPETHR